MNPPASNSEPQHSCLVCGDKTVGTVCEKCSQRDPVLHCLLRARPIALSVALALVVLAPLGSIIRAVAQSRSANKPAAMTSAATAPVAAPAIPEDQQIAGAVAWRLPDQVNEALAFDDHGHVYCAIGDVLKCLDIHDGHEVWRYSFAEPVTGIVHVGDVLLVSSGQALSTFGSLSGLKCSDGSRLWRQSGTFSFIVQPNENTPKYGQIYAFRGADGAYVAKADTGQTLWKYTTPKDALLTEFDLADTGVAMVSTDPTVVGYPPVYTINTSAYDTTTGKLLWTMPTVHGDISAACQSLPNGLVYAKTKGDISRVDPATGKALWTNTSTFGGVSIGPGPAGTLLASRCHMNADVHSELDGIDEATGRTKWTRPFIMYSAPKGDRAFLSDDVNLTCIDQADGHIIWQIPCTDDPLDCFGNSKSLIVNHINRTGPGAMDCIDTATGKKLWSQPTDGQFKYGDFHDGILLVRTYKEGLTAYR